MRTMREILLGMKISTKIDDFDDILAGMVNDSSAATATKA
jgi:hypothetical protein